jgi:hypothetical protein
VHRKIFHSVVELFEHGETEHNALFPIDPNEERLERFLTQYEADPAQQRFVSFTTRSSLDFYLHPNPSSWFESFNIHIIFELRLTSKPK